MSTLPEGPAKPLPDVEFPRWEFRAPQLAPRVERITVRPTSTPVLSVAAPPPPIAPPPLPPPAAPATPPVLPELEPVPEVIPTTVHPLLERWFQLGSRGISTSREVLAGIVTFATMAYILFLNPAILGSVTDGSGTQLGADQLMAVTALGAGIVTIMMGLFTNYPFVLAAGLGLNAFVAFTLVGAQGLTWPQAMGVVVVEGIILVISVLTGIREAVVPAIPDGIKRAITVGIGLFIALIGLVNAGIVVHDPKAGTIVSLSANLATWPILAFTAGLVVTTALFARKVPGSLLLGILATTVIAMVINAFTGHETWLNGVAKMPDSPVSVPDLSLVGNFSFSFVAEIGFAASIAVVLALLLSDFFDSIGTTLGLGEQMGVLTDDGQLPGMKRVLLVDSAAALVGGAVSSSSNTVYVESASGIAEGGRTGLTSFVAGVLFLCAMFFAPLANVIPPEATAPILVLVGTLMAAGAGRIDWHNPGIGVPALLTIVLMPFTYSVTNGIGAGIVAYTLIAVCSGRAREVHPFLYLITPVFVWYFIG